MFRSSGFFQAANGDLQNTPLINRINPAASYETRSSDNHIRIDASTTTVNAVQTLLQKTLSDQPFNVDSTSHRKKIMHLCKNMLIPTLIGSSVAIFYALTSGEAAAQLPEIAHDILKPFSAELAEVIKHFLSRCHWPLHIILSSSGAIVNAFLAAYCTQQAMHSDEQSKLEKLLLTKTSQKRFLSKVSAFFSMLIPTLVPVGMQGVIGMYNEEEHRFSLKMLIPSLISMIGLVFPTYVGVKGFNQTIAPVLLQLFPHSALDITRHKLIAYLNAQKRLFLTQPDQLNRLQAIFSAAQSEPDLQKLFIQLLNLGQQNFSTQSVTAPSSKARIAVLIPLMFLIGLSGSGYLLDSGKTLAQILPATWWAYSLNAGLCLVAAINFIGLGLLSAIQVVYPSAIHLLSATLYIPIMLTAYLLASGSGGSGLLTMDSGLSEGLFTWFGLMQSNNRLLQMVIAALRTSADTVAYAGSAFINGYFTSAAFIAIAALFANRCGGQQQKQLQQFITNLDKFSLLVKKLPASNFTAVMHELLREHTDENYQLHIFFRFLSDDEIYKRLISELNAFADKHGLQRITAINVSTTELTEMGQQTGVRITDPEHSPSYLLRHA